MRLQIEVRDKAMVESNPHPNILVTPCIDEDFWIARVMVGKKQAIVCFPKFGTIGCGFQHEKDWNTNLPITCDAQEIFNHIKHNKGSRSIPDERCLEAIRMLQTFIASLK